MRGSLRVATPQTKTCLRVPRSARALNASRLLVVYGCIEILDEDDFVADGVVDQLVDGAACEEKAVSSGAHSLFLA